MKILWCLLPFSNKHDREQYQIVSGPSTNSEREGALFTSMKNNTN